MEFCELNKEQRQSFALFVKPRTFFNLSIKVLIKIFLSVNKCTLEIFFKNVLWILKGKWENNYLFKMLLHTINNMHTQGF